MLLHKLAVPSVSGYHFDGFPNPHHYYPHPLCCAAAKDVAKHIAQIPAWEAFFSQGKMLGVLIVRNTDNRVYYLAAYSGNSDTSLCENDYFVPPIYDLSQPGEFYKTEESVISNINKKIESLEQDATHIRLQDNLQILTASHAIELQTFKERISQAQREREEYRVQKGTSLTDEEKARLVRESQYYKAELKRLKQRQLQAEEPLKQKLAHFSEQILMLRKERRERSNILQQKIFASFSFLNAQKESRSLLDIFAQSRQQLPPAGAGDCAAPRLLQYAYEHHLTPLTMAEFWYGCSPRGERRVHGCFYPSCLEKCGPILRHMLTGLERYIPTKSCGWGNTILPPSTQPQIVYSDPDIIVVDKPAGLLSVPGKDIHQPDVVSCLQALYPDEYLKPAHRLDMATSGLLLIARNETTYHRLQSAFEHHHISKRYIAWITGNVTSDCGIISLPLCGNPDNRPYQMVEHQYGKFALSRYEVLYRTNGATCIAFSPVTGRTHQLRLHAASLLGLGHPILGDTLYGTDETAPSFLPQTRLLLHAETISFDKYHFCHTEPSFACPVS